MHWVDIASKLVWHVRRQSGQKGFSKIITFVT